MLFTSGCKDCGQGLLKNDSYLSPHTEISPLNPPPSLANRANYAIKTFENRDLLDAVGGKTDECIWVFVFVLHFLLSVCRGDGEGRGLGC
jgi:hypothetical protein